MAARVRGVGAGLEALAVLAEPGDHIGVEVREEKRTNLKDSPLHKRTQAASATAD